MAKPIVGVTSCVKVLDGQNYHHVGEKYHRAIAECTSALPLAIPSIADILDNDALLDTVDGLLFTGSPSNVFPPRYGVGESAEAEPYDPVRDAMTLPLLEQAIQRGIPTLAICRGFQELNVACSGTLHARVHELDGRQDHRRPENPDLDVQYGTKHSISLLKDGLLSSILETRGPIEVNSLHWQAVDKLGVSLQIEAWADDSTVEAISMPNSKGFLLGIQWHPEYKAKENPISAAIFSAFDQAIQDYRHSKQ